MRNFRTKQIPVWETPIADIKLNIRCRDDMTATLRGLQELYANPATLMQLIIFLQDMVLPDIDKSRGRPGMDLWQAFVLAVIKQALDCDYDRLTYLANHDALLRQFLGHGAGWDDRVYRLQTVADNVGHIGPDLIDAASRLAAMDGQRLAGMKPGDEAFGKCDSAVVQANVEWPTDVNLMRDAVRCGMRRARHEAKRAKVAGWRQMKHLMKKLRFAHANVRETRGARLRDVEAYLAQARGLVDKVKGTAAALRAAGGRRDKIEKNDELVELSEILMDQVRRRLVLGEKIPHGEKIFSVHERHARWIAKGKAGLIAELGVPVCVVVDRHGFVLHGKLFWTGGDAERAVPMIEETQRKHPNLRVCSFDAGFSSRENLAALRQMLRLPVMPVRGRPRKADRERESTPEFKALRKQHPLVESVFNALQRHGMRKIRSRGMKSFAQMTMLSILAYNIHRLGTLALRGDREKARRRHRLRAA